jgi:hypothetical protein
MTTMTLKRSNHTGLLLVICVLVVVITFTLPALNQHAIDRRGASVAQQIYNNICDKGPEATFKNGPRTIYCATRENGKYDTAVTEKCNGVDCLVTVMHTKYTEIVDLARYLLRTGAVQVK